MLSIYKNMYELIKSRYPDDYTKIINDHIDALISFYETYEALATIEIMNDLYNYQLDPLNLDVFKDIYDKYGDTKFLVDQLKRYDIKHIKMRYMQELKKLGKEYGCAIQKTA